ncbi:MAG: multiheme c-type cytochrome [Pirellulales bacterium]
MNGGQRRIGLAAAAAAFALMIAAAVGWLPGVLADGPTSQAAQDGEQSDAEKSDAEKSDAASQRREELFVGWQPPSAALVISGMLEGHIEPCGCTGLANQKGGLMRRHTLIKQIAADWKCDALPIDVGQSVKYTGRQAEIKFQRMVDAYRAMNYRAVAFGPADLRLSAGELYTAVVGAGDAPTPFVSANVGLFAFDESALPSFRTIDSGGMKIGVTSVLADSARKEVMGDEIKFKPAAEALAEVGKSLTAAKCDVQVLLVHGTMKETEGLAAKFPQFGIVVTSGGADEPLRRPKQLEHGSLLVEVGRKGIYAGVVGLYKSAAGVRFRYQLVPLDERFADSPEIVKVMASYQQELQNAWEMGFDAYGIKAIDDSGRRQFVGSQKCGDCHSEAFAVWEKTPHAHATESLVHPPERSAIARNFDAECLSCHVTGWEPQKFVPYASGFLGLGKKETPHLAGSGCENCHGPGSKHVAAEEGDADDATLKRLRAEMVLKLDTAERTCIKCHDIENSPDFHKAGAFEKYWKKVEHKGKD